MRRRIGAPIAALSLLAACGGSSNKGAASAPTAGVSQLAITTNDGSGKSSKFEISGATYGVFDDASHAFHVFVVDSAGGKAPDCDHLKEIASSGAKARIVDVWIGKNVTGPGKVDAAGAIAVDATGGAPQMSMGSIDGVAIDFKSMDGKSFDADIVSASGSASGTLHGAVCDASKFSSEGATASGGAVMPPPPDASNMAHSPTEFALEVHQGGGEMTTPVTGNSMVKFDPKTKILAVATWPDMPDFPGEPPNAKPSCDVFTGGVKSLGKKGSVTIVIAKSAVGHGAGKYPVYIAQSFMVMPDPPKTIADANPVENATLDVQKFDDNDFAANYVTTAKMNDMSNVVAGKVCPSGHVDAPAPPKDDKPAKGAKKKK